MQTSQYKIVLLGEAGIGKTKWVQSYVTGYNTTKYIPTIGVDVVPLRVNLTLEDGTQKVVVLNVWDTAGRADLAILKDGYYIGADAAICMYDSMNGEKSKQQFLKEFTRVTNKPMCYVESNVVDKYQPVREVLRLLGYKNFSINN